MKNLTYCGRRVDCVFKPNYLLYCKTKTEKTYYGGVKSCDFL